MHTGRLPLPPPNLPILYPEETLYSWCAQVHAWNGNPSVLNTSKQLFGSPYSGLLHDFPANLKVLHEKTFGLLPDSIDLALNHTLLGYYLPFHEKTASFKILKGVIN